MWFRNTIAALALVILSASSYAADNNQTGKSIALACMGCHGEVGGKTTAIPPIIFGLPTEYFINAMQDFKSGKRPSTIMGRIVKGFNDDEIKAAASYFASH